MPRKGKINMFKSHIIHSGTNEAIDSLGEIKKTSHTVEATMPC